VHIVSPYSQQPHGCSEPQMNICVLYKLLKNFASDCASPDHTAWSGLALLGGLLDGGNGRDRRRVGTRIADDRPGRTRRGVPQSKRCLPAGSQLGHGDSSHSSRRSADRILVRWISITRRICVLQIIELDVRVSGDSTLHHRLHRLAGRRRDARGRHGWGGNDHLVRSMMLTNDPAKGSARNRPHGRDTGRLTTGRTVVYAHPSPFRCGLSFLFFITLTRGNQPLPARLWRREC